GLWSEAIIEPAGDHRTGTGGDVRGHAEDDDLRGGEPVAAGSEHTGEGEDRGESVPEDRRGDEEPQRLMLARPHPDETTREARIIGEERADRVPARGALDLRARRREQDGDREDREPHGGQDRDDAEPQSLLVAGAEEADLGLDDEDEEDDEKDQPSDVAHAPTESGDLADVVGVGYADHDAVVGHLGEFEEDA